MGTYGQPSGQLFPKRWPLSNPNRTQSIMNKHKVDHFMITSNVMTTSVTTMQFYWHNVHFVGNNPTKKCHMIISGHFIIIKLLTSLAKRRWCGVIKDKSKMACLGKNPRYRRDSAFTFAYCKLFGTINK